MGIYWTLWGIGWVLVVITRILLRSVDRQGIYCEYIADKSAPYQVGVISLICVCVALVGGIANAMWAGSFAGYASNESIVTQIGGAIIVDAVPAILTYFLGFFILGLYKEHRPWLQIIFVVTFILSIVLWTIPIARYNSNIEYKEETGISATQDYELYSFCDIPVQQVSGNISGSSFLGIGSVSGNISTAEQLPYWYDDGKGNAIYNSVDAKKSKIIFIEDCEKPFIRIITHYEKELKLDNNIDKVTVNEHNTWQVYEFYLPKQIMQYNTG